MIEKRQHRRRPAKKKLFALIYGKPMAPYSVVNVSEGGLAFRYSGEHPWPPEQCHVDLLFKGEMVVEKMMVQSISDHLVTDKGIYSWQRGVQFVGLDESQRDDMKLLLKIHK